MTTHYTPKWKDAKGNVLIFPARNTLFDSHSDAMEWALGQFIWMVPFGLSTDGVLEFEAKDGRADIHHIAADYGMLGSCCIISGPDGPAALAGQQP
jgi:hypothetical protein